jgi:hypothetical protein
LWLVCACAPQQCTASSSASASARRAVRVCIVSSNCCRCCCVCVRFFAVVRDGAHDLIGVCAFRKGNCKALNCRAAFSRRRQHPLPTQAPAIVTTYPQHSTLCVAKP